MISAYRDEGVFRKRYCRTTDTTQLRRHQNTKKRRQILLHLSLLMVEKGIDIILSIGPAFWSVLKGDPRVGENLHLNADVLPENSVHRRSFGRLGPLTSTRILSATSHDDRSNSDASTVSWIWAVTFMNVQLMLSRYSNLEVALGFWYPRAASWIICPPSYSVGSGVDPSDPAQGYWLSWTVLNSG